ncbi:tRNA (adenosine(37)-N6)-threonylcarbamoyltransferase complex transferase subunit TsaD [Psychroflexus sp. ALD_RP9]|uniref:tRNA (adenosine(37)-N6)-threonylcarbamoyltransferase complex transferase subunit TsaD n=1 Tax=Psychroflexus sp. ALD_RP9 TaxID=2777186 RepID=UPI001A8DADD5|nr:tRNA (adenosine(37)-N6)-threonylcarbamoyltransferase complex transferase subunit TsaD [Psychroflexus sp. ALD_RP9]QSS98278.1 tRNA (adenosine(37)-N6)-threonylcarbamoyltransferase complex transferase subunit TsaD [Psychroflexus sp. ALD_RP9]
MPKDRIFILAVESSCDDTSAAVFENENKLSNVTATQKVHEAYGGVVPELASRAHQQHIVPVIHEALRQANVKMSQLDAVAFTKGPGLMGSLLVGNAFMKSLALSLDIPLIGVNHMQGHILAHFIKDEVQQKAPSFPFLGITISGGHTQIVKVNSHFDMQIIGETLDDAIGEAFDKCGKMFGLNYPAGPEIDQLAKSGNPLKYQFAKPQVKGLDFSFSGLKTSVLYFLQKKLKEDSDFIKHNLQDLCASFQHTAVQILLDKIKKASQLTGIKTIAIGGGVSANSGIREALQSQSKQHNWEVFTPSFEYCTDNAAMIAIVAYFKYRENQFSDLSITAKARLKLTDN